MDIMRTSDIIERRPAQPRAADIVDARLTRIEELLAMVVKCLGIEQDAPEKDEDANSD